MPTKMLASQMQNLFLMGTQVRVAFTYCGERMVGTFHHKDIVQMSDWMSLDNGSMRCIPWMSPAEADLALTDVEVDVPMPAEWGGQK